MAVRIRKFDIKDYEEVVNMHYDLIHTIYPLRKLGEKIYFFSMVQEWIQSGRHIFVTECDSGLTGYSLASVDYNSGLTEPVYFGEIAYVKPEYRKGKSAFLLYNNVVKISDELGLKLVANAFESGDKVRQIQSKFGGKKIFTVMERG